MQSPPSGLIVQSPAASPQSTKRFGSVLGTKKAGIIQLFLISLSDK
jgi:hypothetical protein